MAFYLKNAHVLDVEKGTFFSADVKIENKKSFHWTKKPRTERTRSTVPANI